MNIKQSLMVQCSACMAKDRIAYKGFDKNCPDCKQVTIDPTPVPSDFEGDEIALSQELMNRNPKLRIPQYVNRPRVRPISRNQINPNESLFKDEKIITFVGGYNTVTKPGPGL